MITEEVWSPIEDRNIQKNLEESPIWKTCYRADEITTEIRSKHERWHVYFVKFDGLKPVQLTKQTVAT